jgi:large subunit ribosomal protein LX
LSQVKTFQIKGDLRKEGENLPFHKEVKAVKKEDAVQHLYAEMGSKHKARRFQIIIKSIEETSTRSEET